MFSVSAEPFNSPRRQLYGGWTLKSAGDNIWGQKTWYEMAAKYAPDEETRKGARQWLRWWREFSKKDPSYKKRLRLAGKDYWAHALKPKMTTAQKAWMWQMFNDDSQVPFSKDDGAQRISSFLRHAPHWSYPVMNYMAMTGVPYTPYDKDLPGGKWDATGFNNMGWQRLEDIQEAFKSRGAGPIKKELEDYFLANLPALVKKEEDGMG